MNEDEITLNTLAARLEKAIHADVGMQGLRILLYGWRIKYRFIEEYTMASRKQQAGEPYLTLQEAMHFSHYCGYDLTRD